MACHTEKIDVSTWDSPDTSLYVSSGTFIGDSFPVSQDDAHGYCGSEEKYCGYCKRLLPKNGTACEGCGAPLTRSVK